MVNIVSFLSDYRRGVPTTPVRFVVDAPDAVTLANADRNGKSENSGTPRWAVPLLSRLPDRIADRRIL
jgi:hypothetical protein